MWKRKKLLLKNQGRRTENKEFKVTKEEASKKSDMAGGMF